MNAYKLSIYILFCYSAFFCKTNRRHQPESDKAEGTNALLFGIFQYYCSGKFKAFIFKVYSLKRVKKRIECLQFFLLSLQDAFMLSLDQNGFDVLARVPQNLNNTGVAQQHQYHWKEFRFILNFLPIFSFFLSVEKFLKPDHCCLPFRASYS